MKKLIGLILIVLMLFALVSCKSTEPVEEEPEIEIEDSTVAEEPEDENLPAEETADVQKELPDIGMIEGVIPGVLYQLYPEDEILVKAVALGGNQAGNNINFRDPSTEDIRFVFNIQEWIYFRVDYALEEGLWAVIVPHEKDPNVYTKAYFEDHFDYATCMLFYSEENGFYCGDTFIDNDANEPGFYDIVFFVMEKPVAMIVIKAYATDFLNDISDEQLEKYMAEATEEAKSL